MTHKEQLIADHKDLVKKILKLRDFIGTTEFCLLSSVTQNNLRDQKTAMEYYRKILERRIDRE